MPIYFTGGSEEIGTGRQEMLYLIQPDERHCAVAGWPGDQPTRARTQAWDRALLIVSNAARPGHHTGRQGQKSGADVTAAGRCTGSQGSTSAIRRHLRTGSSTSHAQ
eukprot:67336-Hanusia_phi.AAC.1